MGGHRRVTAGAIEYIGGKLLRVPSDDEGARLDRLAEGRPLLAYP